MRQHSAASGSDMSVEEPETSRRSAHERLHSRATARMPSRDRSPGNRDGNGQRQAAMSSPGAVVLLESWKGKPHSTQGSEDTGPPPTFALWSFEEQGSRSEGEGPTSHPSAVANGGHAGPAVSIRKSKNTKEETSKKKRRRSDSAKGQEPSATPAAAHADPLESREPAHAPSGQASLGGGWTDVMSVPEAWKGLAAALIEGGAHKTEGEQASSGDLQAGGGRADRPAAGAAPVIAVCGPKNSGKSTLACFLVNSLLGCYSRVAFLETDVGQPEFTVPGCLSLHVLAEPVFGPPHTHMRAPARCHFFGDISPKSDPARYLRDLADLLTYYHEQVTGAQQATVPLVINTSGWVRGLGLEVLSTLLQQAHPTHIVQIRVPAEGRNLPDMFVGDPDTAGPGRPCVLKVEAAEGVGRAVVAAVPGAHRTAAEARALRVLMEMHRATGCGDQVGASLRFDEGAAFRSISRALTHYPPYAVPLANLKVLHLLSQVSPSQSLSAINGALVGLGAVEYSPPRALIPLGSAVAEAFPCLGIGLVRSVDVAAGSAHILTAVPASVLQHVRILLHGRIEMPTRLLHAGPLRSPYLCSHSLGTEGTGSATGKSRNNLLRRTPAGVV